MIFFLAMSVTSVMPVRAEDGGFLVWDSAVSRLLAAGMYGVEKDESYQLSVRLKDDKDLYRVFTADNAGLAGRGITLSYEGSFGLLGFSAGYIYTYRGNESEQSFASLFLGSYDPLAFTADDVTDTWYLALNLSSPSYSPMDNVSLGIGGEVMLINEPFYFEDGKGVALRFNLPFSYKNRIIVTPELQWSGSLSRLKGLLPLEEHKGESVSAHKDVFYGGVSISFSY